jgi:sugar lactone lactonase YvrE
MAYDMRPSAGKLYRLDGEGTVTEVLAGVTISNGIGWSPDGETVYYADTGTRRVDAFSYTSELGLHARRPFVTFERERGAPDGLTVDADGCVWVALWGGAAVHRYRPDGSLDGAIELPVTQVTACTFGGDDLRDLFITTSRQEVAEGEQPEAGAIFRARPAVQGLPILMYKG